VPDFIGPGYWALTTRPTDSECRNHGPFRSSLVMCQQFPAPPSSEQIGNNRHGVDSVRSDILSVLVLVLGPFRISANLHFCRVQHALFRFGVDDDTVSDF
jgi:hypothetical protein